jgi:hypothetical protein
MVITIAPDYPQHKNHNGKRLTDEWKMLNLANLAPCAGVPFGPLL